MLFVSEDPIDGQTYYMVCNDQGLCLIRTTSGAIANFVEKHSKGLSANLRLVVGGDPGTRSNPNLLFHHIRRLNIR
jgi:hypothetical protein